MTVGVVKRRSAITIVRAAYAFAFKSPALFAHHIKKAHLNFANYLNSLEQSLTRIEKATDKYNEDHKIASWLTEKSDLVSNHSGKIAATYAAYSRCNCFTFVCN
ncbi:MAG: hypothetical protein LN589_01970 [Rickettsia endosymbiont of Eriopis connexa]|nr:hypothetical protein [Rickettsia endosymbiont of Eriopis connexa]